MNQKRYFTLLVLSLSLSICGAQKALINNAAVESKVQEIQTLYNLSADQTGEMMIIENRRQRNLQQIASIKTETPDLYYAKLKSIRVSTEAGMEKLFNDEQKKILNQQKAQRELQHSETINKLKEEGKTMEEIKLALLRLESEN